MDTHGSALGAPRPKVVVIGGGTGTHTVLRGLKRYYSSIDISAIVTMADSGGSTGRLRDEFGYLPVGDVRMALAALASDDDEHADLVRQLFLHRFERGEGLSGHNFGNLFLTALTDILGSESAATKAASRILRVRGRVIPVTADNVHLVAEYDDRTIVEGERHIDEPTPDRVNHRIALLYTNPAGVVTDEAFSTIVEADCIVLGPGDLYSSLLANCVIRGVPEAFLQSRATVVYVANLMSRPGQTRGMSIGDHVREIERYLGRRPDVILKNTAPLPKTIIAHYRLQGDEAVIDDTSVLTLPVMERDLLARATISQSSADTVVRSLVRHDPDKLARAILSVVYGLERTD